MQKYTIFFKEDCAMFIRKRIVGKNVNAKIPIFMQNILWLLYEIGIDSTDRPHCFRLEIVYCNENKSIQKISRLQGDAEYVNVCLIPLQNPIDARICIKCNDSGVCFMMFEDEIEI